MTAVAAEVPKKRAAAVDTRGFIPLERCQFINTIDIPAINGRTVWVDGSNKAYSGVEFLFDPAGFVRLEKKDDPHWRVVVVPMSNVAAMFPKEQTKT